MRYELGLGILSGDICWVNGPFPCGLFPDWKIFNECGLRSYLEEHERVEADRGYRFGDPEVCKTPGSVFHAKEKKKVRRRVMARQEALNARLKNYKILEESFRHKMEDHQFVFHAILVITQISFEFGGNPLYSCAEYSDE